MLRFRNLQKQCYTNIAKESRVAFDTNGLYFSNTVYFIPLNDLYLLALLNSKLIYWYFKHIASVLGDPEKGGRLRWFRQDVLRIPIYQIDESVPNDINLKSEIIQLVKDTLIIRNEYAIAKSNLDDKRFTLQKRIDWLDEEINHRVYALYDLSSEEIAIVEGKP